MGDLNDAEREKRIEMRKARIAALSEALELQDAFIALSRFIVGIVVVGQVVAGWDVALTGSRALRIALVGFAMWLTLRIVRRWWQSAMLAHIDKTTPAPATMAGKR